MKKAFKYVTATPVRVTWLFFLLLAVGVVLAVVYPPGAGLLCLGWLVSWGWAACKLNSPTATRWWMLPWTVVTFPWGLGLWYIWIRWDYWKERHEEQKQGIIEAIRDTDQRA